MPSEANVSLYSIALIACRRGQRVRWAAHYLYSPPSCTAPGCSWPCPPSPSKQVGLVDELGGLQEAIAAAKEAAGLPQEESKVLILDVPAR